MANEPLLRVDSLGKTFPQRRWWGAEHAGTAVVHNVSLTLEAGRTLGLVGLSGSGKTTVARCIAGLETPTSGAVRLGGSAQLIFQNAAASLNPRFTAAEIVEEPLVIRKSGDRASRRETAQKLMEAVRLPAQAAGKRALAFSGGERRRLAIARALVLEPKLVILDESLSEVDLPVQTQLIDLLADLQQRLSVAYILISHDLALVSRLADEIAVMDAGTIVEQAPVARIVADPQHSRTRDLLAASFALAPGGVH
jgi:ABC-type glutathione transport system ATPase component